MEAPQAKLAKQAASAASRPEIERATAVGIGIKARGTAPNGALATGDDGTRDV